jgi:hypothetical protein
MRNRYPKTITIVSSTGSGNIFAQELISKNLKVNTRWVYHDLNQADKNGVNLVFIRNPYDNIASASEIQFDIYTEKEKEIFINRFEVIDNKIESILLDYQKYTEYSKSMDYITPVTFELLTETPDQFLEYISKKFDMDYQQKRVGGEEVKATITAGDKFNNRVPRPKTPLRKQIDLRVSQNKLIAEEYARYLEYKAILQSTERLSINS